MTDLTAEERAHAAVERWAHDKALSHQLQGLKDYVAAAIRDAEAAARRKALEEAAKTIDAVPKPALGDPELLFWQIGAAAAAHAIDGMLAKDAGK